MPDVAKKPRKKSGKRPCSICRRWFHPDPRVGARQRACSQAECQAARRAQSQAAWRGRNPDYVIASRLQARQAQPEQPPPALRLGPPLEQLPWDLAKDEFGPQGADFLGVMSKLILRAAKDEIRLYAADSTGVPPKVLLPATQTQIRLEAN